MQQRVKEKCRGKRNNNLLGRGSSGEGEGAVVERGRASSGGERGQHYIAYKISLFGSRVTFFLFTLYSVC